MTKTSTALVVGALLATACGGSVDRDATDGTCEAYDATAEASSRTLRIVNDRTQPIYFETRCERQLLAEVDGTRVLARLGGIDFTCRDVRDGAETGGHCKPAWEEIAPGDSLELSWSELFYTEAELPDACNPTNARPNCFIPEAPEPGTDITLIASLYTSTCDWSCQDQRFEGSAQATIGGGPIEIVVD